MQTKSPIKKFTGWLGNVFFSILLLVIALIPVWVFTALWYFLQPVTFWHRFVMIGGGIFLGGFIHSS